MENINYTKARKPIACKFTKITIGAQEERSLANAAPQNIPGSCANLKFKLKCVVVVPSRLACTKITSEPLRHFVDKLSSSLLTHFTNTIIVDTHISKTLQVSCTLILSSHCNISSNLRSPSNMASLPDRANPHTGSPGILHRYTSSLVAFEHATQDQYPPPNIILFIGGLGDGLLSVDYTKAIARHLPEHWSCAEVLISSSYDGWRTGSLARDAEEIENCVKYFRDQRPEGMIVLMGHSTGCQDVMEYHRTGQRTPVEGFILQGAVSDREDAWYRYRQNPADERMFFHTLEVAFEMERAGKGGDIIPAEHRGNIDDFKMTAYRLRSLFVEGGDDDYFSSDIEGEDLDRRIGDPLENAGRVLVLLGERDQHVPPNVDPYALLTKWSQVSEERNHRNFHGIVLKGATHNLNGDSPPVVQNLVESVLDFISELVGKIVLEDSSKS